MHDDQHGTAIITSAALMNASEMLNKKIEDSVICADDKIIYRNRLNSLTFI